jgi:hypothetical protein
MKRLLFLSLTLGSVLCLAGGERERNYLESRMIPFAREFIQRNALPYGTNFGMEKILRYRVEFLTNRPAPFIMSNMRIEKRYAFSYTEDNGVLGVGWFKDVSVETYYDLSAAPKEKIEAVRALNLRNKLNERTALALAGKYFRLQGHDEKNFHPVEFRRLSWAVKGDPDYVPLPFYEAVWYRKDVKLRERDDGIARLPHVRIEVSGMTSNLVSYSKLHMPVGADFESPNPIR